MTNDSKGKGKQNPGKGPENASSPETRTCFHRNKRGHLSKDCPDKQKGKKGDGKSKGAKPGKSRKPKGKRATEMSQNWTEDEPDDAWSEFEGEGGESLHLTSSTSFCSTVGARGWFLGG